MSSFYDVINSSLQATEAVIVAIDAFILINPGTGILSNLETSDNWHDRRVLAIVSHKDERTFTEEGAYVSGPWWLVE